MFNCVKHFDLVASLYLYDRNIPIVLTVDIRKHVAGNTQDRIKTYCFAMGLLKFILSLQYKLKSIEVYCIQLKCLCLVQPHSFRRFKVLIYS